jgi:hypothetical protein
MDPSRNLESSARPQARGLEGDGELWLLWLMLVVGALGVVAGCFGSRAWDGASTVGLLLVVVAGRRLAGHGRGALGRAWQSRARGRKTMPS